MERNSTDMEISEGAVDGAVVRWQAETGQEAVLKGEGRTFVEAREERLGERIPETDSTDVEIDTR